MRLTENIVDCAPGSTFMTKAEINGTATIDDHRRMNRATLEAIERLGLVAAKRRAEERAARK